MKFSKFTHLAIVLLLICTSASYGLWTEGSNAQTQTNFQSTILSISSAYADLYNAELNGGNVTTLVNQLNFALALIQSAQSENATNPSQAMSKLQEANLIVIQVTANSTLVSKLGVSATNSRNSLIYSEIIVTITVALLIYLYGGRLYRLIWRLSYNHYVVKPVEK